MLKLNGIYTNILHVLYVSIYHFFVAVSGQGCIDSGRLISCLKNFEVIQCPKTVEMFAVYFFFEVHH